MKIAKLFRENSPVVWGVFVGGLGRSAFGATLIAEFDTREQAQEFIDSQH